MDIFAKEMADLGEKYGYTPLTEWGKELSLAIVNLEIGKIDELFSDFELLTSSIKPVETAATEEE